MLSLILPGVVVWGAAAGVMVAAYMAVTRQGLLHPATVDPFVNAPAGSPGADTLSDYLALSQTPPPMTPAADWAVTTVSSLSAAEDLLDSLENRNYVEREVFAISNSCFAVRWR